MSDLLVAQRAAWAAADVLLSYYGRPPEGLGSKSSDTDLVSDADREAERAVRELLEAERPRDGLLAEEGSASDADSGRRWVVDPLDGTVNFLYGFPAWAVSIALEDADGLAVGVVHSPIHRETFCAVRGEGAFVLGPDGGREPVRVREPRALAAAMVGTGFSYEAKRRADQAAIVAQLLPLARDIRRAGAAALDLAWLAAGRLDAYFERGLNHWDWAAGGLLVREAGGAAAPLPGEPPGLIAASGAALLDELGELVS